MSSLPGTNTSAANATGHIIVPTALSTAIVPRNALPIIPSANSEVSKKEFDANLIGMEKTILDTILDQPINMVPKPNEYNLPKINFTLRELVQYLALCQPKTCANSGYLTGSAATFVVTAFRNSSTAIPFNDLDAAWYVGKDFKYYRIYVLKFLEKKLNEGNFQIRMDISSFFSLYYIHKQILIPNHFSLISLGDLDVKFADSQTISSNVAPADGFQVSLTQYKAVCINRGKKCSYAEYQQALFQAEHRIYHIADWEKIHNLLFRVLFKMTQGFDIRIKRDILPGIFKKMQDASLKQTNNYLKLIRDFNTHQDNHYRKAQIGRIVDLFNGLTAAQMAHDWDEKAGKEKTDYTRALVSTKLLTNFSKLLTKYPEEMPHLLNVVRGALFLQWLRKNPAVSAYTFDYLPKKDEPVRYYISLTDQDKSYYLALDDKNDPVNIATEFIQSWSILEDKFSQMEKEFRFLPADFGFNFQFTKDQRRLVVNDLILAFQGPHLKKVLKELFSDKISSVEFFKEILKISPNDIFFLNGLKIHEVIEEESLSSKLGEINNPALLAMFKQNSKEVNFSKKLNELFLQVLKSENLGDFLKQVLNFVLAFSSDEQKALNSLPTLKLYIGQAIKFTIHNLKSKTLVQHRIDAFQLIILAKNKNLLEGQDLYDSVNHVLAGIEREETHIETLIDVIKFIREFENLKGKNHPFDDVLNICKNAIIEIYFYNFNRFISLPNLDLNDYLHISSFLRLITKDVFTHKVVNKDFLEDYTLFYKKCGEKSDINFYSLALGIIEEELKVSNSNFSDELHIVSILTLCQKAYEWNGSNYATKQKAIQIVSCLTQLKIQNPTILKTLENLLLKNINLNFFIFVQTQKSEPLQTSLQQFQGIKNFSRLLRSKLSDITKWDPKKISDNSTKYISEFLAIIFLYNPEIGLEILINKDFYEGTLPRQFIEDEIFNVIENFQIGKERFTIAYKAWKFLTDNFSSHPGVIDRYIEKFSITLKLLQSFNADPRAKAEVLQINNYLTTVLKNEENTILAKFLPENLTRLNKILFQIIQTIGSIESPWSYQEAEKLVNHSKNLFAKDSNISIVLSTSIYLDLIKNYGPVKQSSVALSPKNSTEMDIGFKDLTRITSTLIAQCLSDQKVSLIPVGLSAIHQLLKSDSIENFWNEELGKNVGHFLQFVAQQKTLTDFRDLNPIVELLIQKKLSGRLSADSWRILLDISEAFNNVSLSQQIFLGLSKSNASKEQLFFYVIEKMTLGFPFKDFDITSLFNEYLAILEKENSYSQFQKNVANFVLSRQNSPVECLFLLLNFLTLKNTEKSLANVCLKYNASIIESFASLKIQSLDPLLSFLKDNLDLSGHLVQFCKGLIFIHKSRNAISTKDENDDFNIEYSISGKKLELIGPKSISPAIVSKQFLESIDVLENTLKLKYAVFSNLSQIFYKDFNAASLEKNYRIALIFECCDLLAKSEAAETSIDSLSYLNFLEWLLEYTENKFDVLDHFNIKLRISQTLSKEGKLNNDIGLKVFEELCEFIKEKDSFKALNSWLAKIPNEEGAVSLLENIFKPYLRKIVLNKLQTFLKDAQITEITIVREIINRCFNLKIFDDTDFSNSISLILELCIANIKSNPVAAIPLLFKQFIEAEQVKKKTESLERNLKIAEFDLMQNGIFHLSKQIAKCSTASEINQINLALRFYLKKDLSNEKNIKSELISAIVKFVSSANNIKSGNILRMAFEVIEELLFKEHLEDSTNFKQQLLKLATLLIHLEKSQIDEPDLEVKDYQKKGFLLLKYLSRAFKDLDLHAKILDLFNKRVIELLIEYPASEIVDEIHDLFNGILKIETVHGDTKTKIQTIIDNLESNDIRSENILCDYIKALILTNTTLPIDIISESNIYDKIPIELRESILFELIETAQLGPEYLKNAQKAWNILKKYSIKSSYINQRLYQKLKASMALLSSYMKQPNEKHMAAVNEISNFIIKIFERGRDLIKAFESNDLADLKQNFANLCRILTETNSLAAYEITDNLCKYAKECGIQIENSNLFYLQLMSLFLGAQHKKPIEIFNPFKNDDPKIQSEEFNSQKLLESAKTFIEECLKEKSTNKPLAFAALAKLINLCEEKDILKIYPLIENCISEIPSTVKESHSQEISSLIQTLLNKKLIKNLTIDSKKILLSFNNRIILPDLWTQSTENLSLVQYYDLYKLICSFGSYSAINFALQIFIKSGTKDPTLATEIVRACIDYEGTEFTDTLNQQVVCTPFFDSFKQEDQAIIYALFFEYCASRRINEEERQNLTSQLLLLLDLALSSANNNLILKKRIIGSLLKLIVVNNLPLQLKAGFNIIKQQEDCDFDKVQALLNALLTLPKIEFNFEHINDYLANNLPNNIVRQFGEHQKLFFDFINKLLDKNEQKFLKVLVSCILNTIKLLKSENILIPKEFIDIIFKINIKLSKHHFVDELKRVFIEVHALNEADVKTLKGMIETKIKEFYRLLLKFNGKDNFAKIVQEANEILSLAVIYQPVIARFIIKMLVSLANTNFALIPEIIELLNIADEQKIYNSDNFKERSTLEKDIIKAICNNKDSPLELVFPRVKIFLSLPTDEKDLHLLNAIYDRIHLDLLLQKDINNLTSYLEILKFFFAVHAQVQAEKMFSFYSNQLNRIHLFSLILNRLISFSQEKKFTTKSPLGEQLRSHLQKPELEREFLSKLESGWESLSIFDLKSSDEFMLENAKKFANYFKNIKVLSSAVDSENYQKNILVHYMELIHLFLTNSHVARLLADNDEKIFTEMPMGFLGTLLHKVFSHLITLETLLQKAISDVTSPPKYFVELQLRLRDILQSLPGYVMVEYLEVKKKSDRSIFSNVDHLIESGTLVKRKTVSSSDNLNHNIASSRIENLDGNKNWIPAPRIHNALDTDGYFDKNNAGSVDEINKKFQLLDGFNKEIQKIAANFRTVSLNIPKPNISEEYPAAEANPNSITLTNTFPVEFPPFPNNILQQPPPDPLPDLCLKIPLGGKPNHRIKPHPASERPRIVQSPQKGDNAWYYTLKLIRKQYGKKSDDPNRKFEKLLSTYRKARTRGLEDLNNDLQIVKCVLKKFKVQVINSEVAARILQTKKNGLSEKQVQRCKELLKDFITAKENDLKVYIEETYLNKCVYYAEEFFKNSIDNIKLQDYYSEFIDINNPKEKWENLSHLDKAIQSHSSVLRLCKALFSLEESDWDPTKPIDNLLSLLDAQGVLMVCGFFGQTYYIDKPSIRNVKIENRNIYFWKPDAKRNEILNPHYINIVGIDKKNNLIYYIDPLDGSDPENPEQQKIYEITYENFKSYITDIYNTGRITKKDGLKVHVIFPGKN